MRRPPTRVLLDAALSIALLYLSSWIYEASNFAVLSLSGIQASVSVSGVWPTGTSAITTSPAWSPFAKVVQTAMAALVVVPVLGAARKRRMILSEVSAVSILSIFLSSFYWEALGSVSSLSYAVHVLVYVGLTGVVEVVLLALLDSQTRRMATRSRV